MSRALVTAGLILATWGAAPCAQGQPSEDMFLAAHRAGIAANAPTHRVFLRHPAGTRVFHAREPIELEMVIEPAAGVTPARDWRPCAGWQMVEVVFDRPVVNVWRSICPEYNEGLSVGVAGCGAGCTGGRWTMPVRLNGPFRFDAPGRYRLFVRSGHVKVAGRPAYTRHETSELFELEILPRDAAWEADVARRAAAVLADGESTPGHRAAARDSLATLGTRVATGLLIEHADASERLGHRLLAADDLSFALLTCLEAELRRPDRVVDASFIRGVAQVARVVRRPQGPPYPWDEYLDLIEHYAIERVRALQTVPGALPAALRAEFDAAVADALHRPGALWPALHTIPQDVESVFRVLEAPVKARLLQDHWEAFDSPVFLPMIRRTHEGPAHVELRDVALRRLHQLSPDEARAAILARLADDLPGVSIETLGLLPDAALPSLEGRWVELLEQSFDEGVLTSAAERLARYGSAASVSRAADAWLARHDDWPLAIDPPLIAFLVRVAPERARQILKEVMADSMSALRDGFDTPLIGAVAAWQWGPPLEAAAIDALTHADSAIVDDAAQALSAHGGKAARAALENTVRREAALARRAAPALAREAAEAHEGRVASALADARGWHLSERERSAWRAICGGRPCRDAFRSRRTGRLIDIHVSGPEFERPQPLAFRIDDVALPSVAAVVDKMRQFPRGSGFYLKPFMRHSAAWPDRERRALLDSLRTAVAADGLSVWMRGIDEP